jgi:hypothetical protein
MRLNAIAALRALTMAMTISKNVRHPGHPFAAYIIPTIANGSAKTECLIFIISR